MVLKRILGFSLCNYYAHNFPKLHATLNVQFRIPEVCAHVYIKTIFLKFLIRDTIVGIFTMIHFITYTLKLLRVDVYASGQYVLKYCVL